MDQQTSQNVAAINSMNAELTEMKKKWAAENRVRDQERRKEELTKVQQFLAELQLILKRLRPIQFKLKDEDFDAAQKLCHEFRESLDTKEIRLSYPDGYRAAYVVLSRLSSQLYKHRLRCSPDRLSPDGLDSRTVRDTSLQDTVAPFVELGVEVFDQFATDVKEHIRKLQEQIVARVKS